MNIKNKGIGWQSVVQSIFTGAGLAIKTLSSVLGTPSGLITGDSSSTPQLVGKGNLVRIIFSAKSYVAFGDATASAPSSSTVTAAEVPATTYMLFTATADYLVTSAAPTRCEVYPG